MLPGPAGAGLAAIRTFSDLCKTGEAVESLSGGFCGSKSINDVFELVHLGLKVLTFKIADPLASVGAAFIFENILSIENLEDGCLYIRGCVQKHAPGFSVVVLEQSFYPMLWVCNYLSFAL